VEKLRKSVSICQSYRKNKSVLFFYGPQCISSRQLYKLDFLGLFLGYRHARCNQIIQLHVKSSVMNAGNYPQNWFNS